MSVREFDIELTDHAEEACHVWLHDDGRFEADYLWAFLQPEDYAALKRTVAFVVEFMNSIGSRFNKMEVTRIL